MKAIKAIDNIKEKGERLYVLRRVIEDIEKRHQEELGTLKEQREVLQNDLLASFKRIGIDQIKVNDGSSVARAVRKGLEVTSEAHALQWCIDNRAVSINKVLVKQKLEGAKEAPAGFEFKEVEYISVRKPKADKEPEVKE